MEIFDISSLIKVSKKMELFLKYVNNNSKNIVNDSIEITAKHINCSISTINRFTRKLGFNSYSKFKMYIYKYISSNSYVDNKKVNFNKIKMKLINDDNVLNIKSDFKNTFTENFFISLEKLAKEIWERKSLNVLYNIKGTFLASLLRNELNALGIVTVVSKTEKDFINISKNVFSDNKNIILVFSEKNLMPKSISELRKYRYSVLVSKKRDINTSGFKKFIPIVHKNKYENNNLFDITRYLIHLWIISNLVNWIKMEKRSKK